MATVEKHPGHGWRIRYGDTDGAMVSEAGFATKADAMRARAETEQWFRVNRHPGGQPAAG